MEIVDGDGCDAEVAISTTSNMTIYQTPAQNARAADLPNEGTAEVSLALPYLYQIRRVLWAAKAVATPTKTDEEALVMAVDEASVVALYVAVAGVVMTMHELLTQ
ncbi:hypothetical protein PC129_g5787 [Phytophthora cactorum]|uniref:Uncharacterized protein n=1 Tax=Phytophthora cactorum TaxID=29920 RepID=A0A8T1EJN3_9STRA|nr:hypothetical protein PC111_g2588 [Phytophthora cactorum]KAG2953747.1 hypothetical protein PC117_g1714 [Phytophthora cactorum]KAG3014480.1 hypothetical protein PC120_g12655 [Phytophthora cactorum]KAG3223543.1 hypothetical protein PC129_g5787 [Phytophthora cactorum]KAG4053088.1 hypothetical protein PC123_g11736 [Phytophthora cactorum]